MKIFIHEYFTGGGLLNKDKGAELNELWADRNCKIPSKPKQGIMFYMETKKTEIPIEKVQALCKRYQVKGLALFGSAVNGQLHEKSDIDFLVEFMPDAQIGFSMLLKLQRELSSLLERPVDMVPKNGLKPLIRDEVISSAQVLYAA